MKHYILASAFLMLAIIATHAQETSVGIKGGFNAANTKTESGFETDTRSGFHVGLYAETRLSDLLAVQPEIVYSQQGFTEVGAGGDTKRKIDYINIPVMLKVYVIPGLYAEAGPQIGFEINDTEEFSNNLVSGRIERDPNSFDYGVGLGAGFKLINGLMIGARYNIGLGELYDDVDFNNRVFQVSLGIDL